MFVLVFALLIGASEPASPYPPDAECAQPTTVAMAACGQEQARIWEERRKAEYSDALQRAPAEMRVALQKAEQLWLDFREANCAIYAGHDGTIKALLATGCRWEMTKARALELHDMEW